MAVTSPPASRSRSCPRRWCPRRGSPPRSGWRAAARQARRPHRFRGRRQQGPPARTAARGRAGSSRPTCSSPAARSGRTSCRPPPRPRSYAGLRCVVVIAGVRRSAASRTRTSRPRVGVGRRAALDRRPGPRLRRRHARRASPPSCAATGARPYVVPRGGANALGATRLPARRRRGLRAARGDAARPTVVVAAGPAARSPGSSPGASRTAGRSASSGSGEPPARASSRRAVLELAREVARAAGRAAAGPARRAARRRPRSRARPRVAEAATPRPRLALRTRRAGARPRLHGEGAGRAARGWSATGPALFWHTGGLLDAVAETRSKETAMTASGHRLGPPLEGPAPELVESGFALENADAPLLHAGLNLADLAHVLDLRPRGRHPARRRPGGCWACCSRPSTTPAEEFPYDPGLRRAVQQPGAVLRLRASATTPAGCTPAGRAARRSGSRCGCTCAASSSTSSTAPRRSPTTIADRGRGAQPHLDARPDLPAARAALDLRPLPALVRLSACCATRERLLDALGWTNTSPGGAGCVNGSRLLDDRGPVAPDARLRRRHRAHPRRDVADRRPGRRARRRGQPRRRRRASSPRTSRSGPAASSTTSTSPTATAGRAC